MVFPRFDPLLKLLSDDPTTHVVLDVRNDAWFGWQGSGENGTWPSYRGAWPTDDIPEEITFLIGDIGGGIPCGTISTKYLLQEPERLYHAKDAAKIFSKQEGLKASSAWCPVLVIILTEP